MIKVLHFADLHLGSSFLSLSGQSRARKDDLKGTFLRIINICKIENVDLLLAVGDIFDSWSIPEDDIVLVRDGFSAIPKTKVVIAAGNHDPLTIDSAYVRKNFWSDNVVIMPEAFSSVLIDDLQTEVWGASFESAYQYNSLLSSIEPQKTDYLQIGAIHGTLGSDSVSSEYNPISTTQIQNSGLDYLALGHIHKFSEIKKADKVSYAYPGCPEGRGFDELGEKGVIIGEISKNQNNLDFMPIANRLYLEYKADISGCYTATEAAEKIVESLINEYGDNYTENIYKIYLEGRVPEDLPIENILPLLSELYFAKIRDNTTMELDLEATAKEIGLRGIFVQKMIEKIEASTSNTNEQALQLGLKAFLGKVDYYEN